MGEDEEEESEEQREEETNFKRDIKLTLRVMKSSRMLITFPYIISSAASMSTYAGSFVILFNSTMEDTLSDN